MKQVNASRAFLLAQVMPLYAEHHADPVQLGAAVDTFLEQLAGELGELIGTTAIHPNAVFGRFISTASAAILNAVVAAQRLTPMPVLADVIQTSTATNS